MKVMVVLGTRPEIIRLSRVIARLDDTPGIEQVLVHTGQNYDPKLNEIFFSDLGLRKPDHHLEISRDSLGAAYGDILRRSEEVLLAEQPQALMVLGDTNSALSAIMAKRMHIPVFHMEAGNRSFDENVPEEVNRKIVDHIADFNLVYTEHARRHLLAEGLPSRRVFLTGSPMREVLDHQQSKIDASTATAELGLERDAYFLLSAHREENVDSRERLRTLMDTVAALHEQFDLPIIATVHPRTRRRMEEHRIPSPPGMRSLAPFGYSDYCRLQLDARCVLSDSGTITEEAAILGLRAVTLRDSMERPEGLDTGSIMLVGLERSSVIPAVRAAVALPVGSPPTDYQPTDTSHRVVRLLLGLTGRHRAWSGLHER
jgi:UDP-N-acetylglucosamine 2-epimerase